jgi:hypothetical protein
MDFLADLDLQRGETGAATLNHLCTSPYASHNNVVLHERVSLRERQLRESNGLSLSLSIPVRGFTLGGQKNRVGMRCLVC